MTVDSETLGEGRKAVPVGPTARTPSGAEPAPAPSEPVPVSPGVVVAYGLLLAGLLGWLLYGVFVQRQGLVDSVGESLGTGFALLLVISIVGSLRRGRG